MCGRFASQLPPELLRRVFAVVGDIPTTVFSWNVAPTQAAVVIHRDAISGRRRCDAMSWGLVPRDTKSLDASKRPFNARAETLVNSHYFRRAFAHRRCLVPADAFYEWNVGANGKQPYAIARADGAPLAFAGMWDAWRSPDGETLRTFAIATTTASTEMAELHDRMPVIVEPDGWPVWLGEIAGDYAALLRPAPSGTVRFWPVSRAVN